MSEDKMEGGRDDLEAAIEEAGGFKGAAESMAGGEGPDAAEPSGGDGDGKGDAGQEAGKPEGEPESKPESKAEDKADPLDVPITDFSKVDLGLSEDMQASAEAIESFGKMAIETGLTPRQAQALAQWQVNEIKQARERMIEEGVKELSKAWGKEAGAKREQVLRLIEKIDAAAGDDSFSRSLDECGASLSPAFIKGMLAVAMMFGEDSVGSHANAGSPVAKETALDGLKDVFAKAMRK